MQFILYSSTQEGLSRIEAFKALKKKSKAEECLFQIKFKMAARCVKLMNRSRAALVEPGAPATWPLALSPLPVHVPEASGSAARA